MADRLPPFVPDRRSLIAAGGALRGRAESDREPAVGGYLPSGPGIGYDCAMRSRRNRYRDDPYVRRGRRGGGGDTCLRDACLLETGCCIGEAIDGSCLVSALLLSPRLVGALTRSPASSRPLVGRLVAAILLYQREISANRAPCCRFTPSCSQYAIEALHTHGARRGLLLSAARLLRCRPGGRRGPDPVPLPRNVAVA